MRRRLGKSSKLQAQDVKFLLTIAKREGLVGDDVPVDLKALRNVHRNDEFVSALLSGAEDPQVILLLANLPNLRGLRLIPYPGLLNKPLNISIYLPKISHGFHQLRSLEINGQDDSNVRFGPRSSLDPLLFWEIGLISFIFKLPKIEFVTAFRFLGFARNHPDGCWAQWSCSPASSNVPELHLNICAAGPGDIDKLIKACKTLKEFALEEHEDLPISHAAFDVGVLSSLHADSLTNLTLILRTGHRGIQLGVLRKFTSVRHLIISHEALFDVDDESSDFEDDDATDLDDYHDLNKPLVEYLPRNLETLYFLRVDIGWECERLSNFVQSDWAKVLPHFGWLSVELVFYDLMASRYLPELLNSFVGCKRRVKFSERYDHYWLLDVFVDDSPFTKRDLINLYKTLECSGDVYCEHLSTVPDDGSMP